MLKYQNLRRFSSFINKMSQNISKQAERAQRIQYNVMNQMYSIQHEAKLKQKLDLHTSVESLQKQMGRQIAQSLKRSESKVAYLIQKAREKFSQHQKKSFKQDQIKQYNNLVNLCEKARWEYIVHRNSCGFRIKNYQLVTSLYVLPPKIDIKEAGKND